MLPGNRHPSHQRCTAGRLPRPTALPPLLFVPVRHHGLRRRAGQPQTAVANQSDVRGSVNANATDIVRLSGVESVHMFKEREAAITALRFEVPLRYLLAPSVFKISSV